MAEWPIRRMDELCEVTSSKRIYATELVADGVPFLKSKEIIEKVSGQHHANLLYISEHRFQEIAQQTGSIEEGDVLLTSRGTLGVPYVVSATDRFHFADGNLTWFRRFAGLDSNYLCYFLLSPMGKAELSKCVIGSSQQAYTIAALKRAEIPLPPLPIQRRIAGILSPYDELIENSQRRIKILEAMARALYREWFVHFRFPGHEHHPRVPSPLGEIPKGWEVKLVKDILARRAAGTVYREADVKQEGAIAVLDQSTNELLGFHDNEADHVASPESPLGIFGDHTCKTQLLIEPFSVGPNVVPFAAGNGLPTAYVFYAVSNLVQTQEYKRHWSPLTAKEIVVADNMTAQRFAFLIQQMLIEQATLRKVTRNLRRTRDLLLPRLLSGQIDVEAIES